VDFFTEGILAGLVMQITKRREIFKGKAYRVEHRDLGVAFASWSVVPNNAEIFDDRKIRCQLLNVTAVWLSRGRPRSNTGHLPADADFLISAVVIKSACVASKRIQRCSVGRG